MSEESTNPAPTPDEEVDHQPTVDDTAQLDTDVLLEPDLEVIGKLDPEDTYMEGVDLEFGSA